MKWCLVLYNISWRECSRFPNPQPQPKQTQHCRWSKTTGGLGTNQVTGFICALVWLTSSTSLYFRILLVCWGWSLTILTYSATVEGVQMMICSLHGMVSALNIVCCTNHKIASAERHHVSTIKTVQVWVACYGTSLSGHFDQELKINKSSPCPFDTHKP